MFPVVAFLTAASPAALSGYAGTYRVADLLRDPAVALSLARLPPDLQATVRNNLTVTGPIELDGPGVFLRGNAAHLGGQEEVALAATGGQVQLAVLDLGSVTCVGPRLSEKVIAVLRIWKRNCSRHLLNVI
jgi:hypothetical protein